MSADFLPLLAHATLHDQRLTTFFTQLLLLIVVGRGLGEVMQRLRQPSVIGQLLAGIILGPSVFGAISPGVQHALFPTATADRQMLHAVSELGILLLLLLTGMETDLALVKRVRRAAAITSVGGILFPLLCGYILGEFLPASLLPDPSRRILTSLFLATSLAISSVKIVAAVLREVDFLRRDLGQVILAAAIIDDTIGWTILALIAGLAAQGKVVFGPLLLSVFGTIAILGFCFTWGSRWVAYIIRWTNDHLVIEMPVISAILVIMMLLALTTHAIGVHTVLGAFVAGIMIGQSPILTDHIEEQLRGLIVALFMPVFFGVAGLSIDLKVLGDLHLLGLTFLLICIASIGKLGGCYVGSRIAGMARTEALAIGLGMNARGSTEVILATIGLGMGVLNQRLFTMIVLMALVTTLCMPPLLRWALARTPLRDEEKRRMDAEAAEEHDVLPKVKRMLVGLDATSTGRRAAQLAGWLIGSRNLTATVLDCGISGESATPASAELLRAAADADRRMAAKVRDQSMPPGDNSPLAVAGHEAHSERLPLSSLIAVKSSSSPTGAEGACPSALEIEEKNGYDLLFLGMAETTPNGGFPESVQRIVLNFTGPVAILLDRGKSRDLDTPLTRILVPTTGAGYSRLGAEAAVAIAKGCGATITALHVAQSVPDTGLRISTQRSRRSGRALLGDIAALAQREGVQVQAKVVTGAAKENAILRQATLGDHQLIVLGAKAWVGAQIHFGQSAEALLAAAPCPVLVLKS